MKILIIDDDDELVELLRFALSRSGFEVAVVTDALGAMEAIGRERPDAIVLDVNLGAWSGLDLLKEIRSRATTPIIMLTARDAEQDKIKAFERGADDYLAKPFSHRELAARLNALLRRSGGAPPPRLLQVGPFEMDERDHAIRRNGVPLPVSVTEYRLLHRLMVDAGTVVPNEILLRHVWGADATANTDVLRVTLHRLRQKMEDDPRRPRYLRTIPRFGVIFAV